ncbi:MAG: nucleotide exchange factor GrpE [Bacteroidales bacterium]|nr:nucleotide exchange factor GrpE [Bacteroidales bacterium]
MEATINADKKKQAPKKKQSSASKKTKKKEDKDKLLKDLNSKLRESNEKLKEWHDKYLRLSAEFDNYRKRTLKEKIDLTRAAGEQMMLSLLPVIDDFERGIQNLNDSKEISAVKEGMILIYNKFKSFLNQNGIKEIDAREKDFNIDLHEAVTKIPAPKKELKGKVVDVIQKGYTLNEKVIRFSKVVIGE